jgi:hypothetical protein
MGNPSIDERAPVVVSRDVLDRILTPYKREAVYLQRATVDGHATDEAVVAARGDFAIPGSCYIADTGHFNAVEFNICYNQLAYALLGQCVLSSLLPALQIPTFEEYRRRQLPDFLILRLSNSFRQAIDPRGFEGSVAVRTTTRKTSMLLIDTVVRFWDARGGNAEGEVLLGVIDSARRRAQG